MVLKVERARRSASGCCNRGLGPAPSRQLQEARGGDQAFPFLTRAQVLLLLLLCIKYQGNKRLFEKEYLFFKLFYLHLFKENIFLLLQ